MILGSSSDFSFLVPSSSILVATFSSSFLAFNLYFTVRFSHSHVEFLNESDPVTRFSLHVNQCSGSFFTFDDHDFISRFSVLHPRISFLSFQFLLSTLFEVLKDSENHGKVLYKISFVVSSMRVYLALR